jgi:hypothetical protein
VAGTDTHGNAYPAGISASSGTFSGSGMTGADITASTFAGGSVTSCSISNPTLSGGTISETQITFDQVGGVLLVYSSSVTTVTLTSGSTWTAPAGTYTQGKVELWGADASGGGGSGTYGGEGGGAGAYACEPSYPLTPGNVYNIQIGAGGPGVLTGSAGSDGGLTGFDGGWIIANGGRAGSSFTGGAGAGLSGSTIGHAGGSGGNGGLGAASAGGGGRAGSTGAGGNGGNGGGSPGAAGAAGSGTGGHAGGAGVATGTAGNAGGGGSGAGKGGSGTTYQTLYYDATSTASYYGSGSLKNNNGTMYQGAASGYAGVTGNQFSFANYNYTQIASDWSGWTIDQVTLTINCQGAWYNTGGYICYGYANSGGNHYSQSSYFVYAGSTNGPTDVTAVLGPVIAGGATSFEALTIGPDPLFQDLDNYVYFEGGAGAGSPRLTITGHTGSGGSFRSGAGQNGVIKVTYVSASTLIGAIAPVAGNDGQASPNAYGAGYTGTVQALVGSPTAVETWHTITGASGLTGTLRCKKVAEHNMVMLDVDVAWSGTTAQTFTLGSLPDSTYYPTVLSPGNSRVYGLGNNSTSPAAYAAAQIPRVFIPSSGALQILVPATSIAGGSCSSTVTYPTD